MLQPVENLDNSFAQKSSLMSIFSLNDKQILDQQIAI